MSCQVVQSIAQIDKSFVSWYIFSMQDWSEKRWQIGKKNVAQIGDCFYLMYTRRVEGQSVDTKVIVDPFRDKDLSERVSLCLNALVGVSTERLKILLDNADRTHNDVMALVNEALSRPRKKITKFRVKAVKRG